MARAGCMRLDEALVVSGFAKSRSRARDMIIRGTVTLDGVPATKPAYKVQPDMCLAVADTAGPYVSRAALKLIAGLDAFNFDPGGLHVLDLGASTGGFSQVLLERGAAHVFAVDVGHGQLDPFLAGHPRLTLNERLNARDLAPEHVADVKVGALVADLSFISLRLGLPPALALSAPGAWGIFLVKPQFEVGRAHVARGGIVRDPSQARAAVNGVADWLSAAHGWCVIGTIPSPVLGGDGNAEFLVGAQKPSPRHGSGPGLLPPREF